METIDLELVQKDKEVKPEVLEVYELLERDMSHDKRAKWLERYNNNWEIIENEIWTDKEKEEMLKEKQIPFCINKVVKGVQGSCAIQTNNRPGIVIRPVGSGDLYISELLQRGFNLVWDKNEGGETVYEFVEDAEVGAIGFINIRLDKSKTPFGTIIFEEDPPDDIYFSADSKKRDFSDTEIIKAKARDWNYIHEKYPKLKERDVYFNMFSKGDAAKSSGVEGADNYAEGETEPDHIPPDMKKRQKIIWEIEAWLLKTVEEDWFAEIDEETGAPRIGKLKLEEDQEVDDKYIEKLKSEKKIHWPRTVQKRVQRIIVGKTLVSEKENPFGEDADGDPAISLIGLKGQRTRSAYPMCNTDYAKDVNKEKNKRRIQSIHAVSHQINAPVIYNEDVKWSGNPGTPGSSAKVPKNAGPNPVYRLQSGGVDIGLIFRLEMMADEEINDIYNMQDVMKGKLPKGGEDMSGRLGLALQDAVGVMTTPSVRRLEAALIRMAKTIVSLMLRHWQRFQWERLLEDEEKSGFAPKGTPEEETLRKLDQEDDSEAEAKLKDLISAKWQDALEKIRPKDPTKPPGFRLMDIDIRIDSGSTRPTNRVAKSQLGLQKVEAGVWDVQAFLEYDDDPNTDRILSRLKEKEQREMEAAAIKGAR